MAQPDQSVEVRYGWVIVFASLLIHSISLGPSYLLFVALKPIAADLGSLRAIPSMAYSLLMIGVGVGGVAMGWWMDKRGVMQPVLFGGVMIGLGAFLTSRSEGAWSLYVANGLLMGLLGMAAMTAPIIANATRWFDRRRGIAVAFIASGQGVAGTIWPPVARYFIDAVGWRQTYVYCGFFVIATILPLALLLRPKPPIAPPGQAHGGVDEDGRVLGLPSGLVQGMFWLAVVCCCTAMAIPIVHLFSYATDLGHPAPRAAELLSVLFAAAFVSRLAYGMLADRIGAIRTLIIGSVCQATMLVVFSIVDSLTGLYLAAMLFGIGFAGIMPCYPLIIRILFPAGQAGWRIACHYFFSGIGMAMGGWLGGAVFDWTGAYVQAFLAGAALNAVNLALVWVLYIRQKRIGLSPRLA